MGSPDKGSLNIYRVSYMIFSFFFWGGGGGGDVHASSEPPVIAAL